MKTSLRFLNCLVVIVLLVAGSPFGQAQSFRVVTVGDNTINILLIQQQGDNKKQLIAKLKGSISIGVSGPIESLNGTIQSLESQDGTRLNVTKSELKDGTLVITTEGGRTFVIYDLNSNLVGRIREAEPASSPAATNANEKSQSLSAQALNGSSVAAVETPTARLLEAADNDDAQVDAVRKLITGGADVNATDSNGFTPLMMAAARGHADVVKLLLAAGANKEMRDTANRNTALIDAAEGGHTDVVKALLDAGANKEARDTYDWYTSGTVPHVHKTPLIAAAAEGQTAVVKVLLDAGANKEAGDYSGWTPLMLAAANGHRDTVQLLLNAGVNVNASDVDNPTVWTALVAAAKAGHSEIVKLLMDAGADKDTALLWAAREGSIDSVRLLLAAGAHVEARDPWKQTALALAADAGRADMVKLLLDAGAKTETASFGGAALTRAASKGHVDVVKLLLAAGANVNAREDDGGWTVLMNAAMWSNTETVKVLLAAGADVNAQINHPFGDDLNGKTALYLARNKPDIVALLIAAGAK